MSAPRASRPARSSARQDHALDDNAFEADLREEVGFVVPGRPPPSLSTSVQAELIGPDRPEALNLRSDPSRPSPQVDHAEAHPLSLIHISEPTRLGMIS